MNRLLAVIVMFALSAPARGNVAMGPGKWVPQHYTFHLDRDYPEYAFFIVFDTRVIPLPLRFGESVRVAEDRNPADPWGRVVAVPRAALDELNRAPPGPEWFQQHSGQLMWSNRLVEFAVYLGPDDPHEVLETTYRITATGGRVRLETESETRARERLKYVGVALGLTLLGVVGLVGWWVLRRSRRQSVAGPDRTA